MNIRLTQMEKANRNNKHFPLYLYPLRAYSGKSVFLPHWHTEYEIIIADCKGLAEFDNMQIHFFPGELLFVNQEVLHRVDAYSDGTITAIVFDLSLLSFPANDICQIEILEKMKAKKLLFPQIIQKGDCYYSALHENISDIIAYFYSDIPMKELKIKALFYDLIFNCYSENIFTVPHQARLSHTEHMQMESIKSALYFIETNYHKHITLTDMAEHVHLSKFYFIKLFQEFTDTTPALFLKNVRLENSKACLLSGLSVTETALLCGFQNISYYIRSFKNQFGMTPKEFQKNPKQK